MELTNKELEMIARSRVSKPFKWRIYIASIITVGIIIASGIPSGASLWQMIIVPVVATIYFTIAIWQGKGLEVATSKKLKEWQDEIGEKA